MEPLLVGFLHGCAAEPDDSTQRLILADWLDDHGQSARARFVRLQCRLADWVPDWNERQELINLCEAVQNESFPDWFGRLSLLCEHVEFVRGLARVWVRGRVFCSREFREAIAAQAQTALIESIRITRTKKLRRIASQESLAHFPALSLANLGLPDDEVSELLQSPHLDRLATLDLSNNRLTSLGIEQLSRSALLKRLSRLEIRNNTLDDEDVLRLLQSTTGGNLRELDAAGPAYEPDTLRRLAPWRDLTRRVVNSLGMEFVRIPAGSFLMGSLDTEDNAADRDNERPRHPVTLTRPFWLDRFPVTQAAYQAVMRDNPARFQHYPGNPVENVDYEMVTEFCRRLSALPAERAAGRSYRLPTEAQWEHACRAGTVTPFHFGPPQSTDFINYDGRHAYGGAPRGVYLGRTQPAGSYPPNRFGLYEMHGNVWEWTADWYASNYEKADSIDPTGPVDGVSRVIRGGCWEAVGAYCRAAHRYGEEVDSPDSYTGFRVVLEMKD